MAQAERRARAWLLVELDRRVGWSLFHGLALEVVVWRAGEVVEVR